LGLHVHREEPRKKGRKSADYAPEFTMGIRNIRRRAGCVDPGRTHKILNEQDRGGEKGAKGEGPTA